MNSSIDKVEKIGVLQLQIHSYDCSVQQVISSGKINSLEVVSALAAIRDINRKLRLVLENIKSFNC